ncbi:MAG: AAA family ATPase [Synergistota bacterium]|nr:AAA family ATPase [Synergistota bacterium]
MTDKSIDGVIDSFCLEHASKGAHKYFQRYRIDLAFQVASTMLTADLERVATREKVAVFPLVQVGSGYEYSAVWQVHEDGKISTVGSPKRSYAMVHGEDHSEDMIFVCDDLLEAAAVAQLTDRAAAVIADRTAWREVAEYIRGVESERHDAVFICSGGWISPREARQAGFPVIEAADSWVDLSIRHGRDEAASLFQSTLDEAREVAKHHVEVLSLDNLPSPSNEQHLWHGVFRRNTLNAIVGAPESGKSFLGIDLGLAIAAGLPSFLGREVAHGEVIYLAAEGADGLQKRVQAWRQVHGIDGALPFHVVPRSIILANDKAREGLVSGIKDNGIKPTVVFVDTLSRVYDQDENSNQHMANFVRALDDLREKLGGPTIVLLHHTTKSTGDLRGAGALLGALDNAVGLIRSGKGRGGEVEVTMRCLKSKDLSPFMDVALSLRKVDLSEGSSCTIALRDERRTTADLTGTAAAALDALRGLGKAGEVVALEAWRREVYAKIEAEGGTMDAARRAFSRARQELQKAKVISVNGGEVHLKTTPSGKDTHAEVHAV